MRRMNQLSLLPISQPLPPLNQVNILNQQKTFGQEIKNYNQKILKFFVRWDGILIQFIPNVVGWCILFDASVFHLRVKRHESTRIHK